MVQPIARQLGLTQLGTLHERSGDTLTTTYPEGEGWGRSAWGRFFGQRIDNRYQAYADPRASGRLLGVPGRFRSMARQVSTRAIEMLVVSTSPTATATSTSPVWSATLH